MDVYEDNGEWRSSCTKIWLRRPFARVGIQ